MESWDYEKDRVTVSFNSRKTSADALIERIRNLGFEAELAGASDSFPSEEGWAGLMRAPEPPGATGLLATFRAALGRNEPLVLLFSASWCTPCLRMKKETFADASVLGLLGDTGWIEVDVDEHPEVADLYRVDSVPQVIFVDRKGMIRDRMRGFEKPEPFATRLRKLLDVPRKPG